MRKLHFIILLFIINLFSCISHKNMTILDDNKSAFLPIYTAYKIQKGDALNIQVTSATTNDFFAKDYNPSQGMNNSESSTFINSYIVNDSGMVDIPLIGKVNVTNLTLNQIETLLKDEIENYLNFVTVQVKLTNFKISVLGEVKSPNTLTIYNSRVTLLQAISHAGGLTNYANNTNIRIYRKEENGNVKEFIISLKDKSQFESEVYDLHPNDVVYVSPLKTKVISANASTIQVGLSFVTFLVVVLNLLSRN